MASNRLCVQTGMYCWQQDDPPPPAHCAGVLALPADHEGDLVAAFAALWRHSALPPLMQAGVMEAAGVLRHYVLVHDASSMGPGVLAAAQEKLRCMASTLGSSCQLLTINSGSGGGAPVDPRLWADMRHGAPEGGGAGEPAQRPAPPAAGLGAWLSEGDMSALAAFVHELAVRCVLPHLEARLRGLNVQVTANRKGLRNQLKSLLWRKGASSSSGQDSPQTPATPSAAGAAAGGGAAGAACASGSVESHMRQLSDLALMLGDYDTASATLRLLGSDIKADRAFKAYAGVQEALGAAAVLSGAPPSEVLASYKEALYRYSQVGGGAGGLRPGQELREPIQGSGCFDGSCDTQSWLSDPAPKMPLIPLPSFTLLPPAAEPVQPAQPGGCAVRHTLRTAAGGISPSGGAVQRGALGADEGTLPGGCKRGGAGQQ